MSKSPTGWATPLELSLGSGTVQLMGHCTGAGCQSDLLCCAKCVYSLKGVRLGGSICVMVRLPALDALELGETSAPLLTEHLEVRRHIVLDEASQSRPPDGANGLQQHQTYQHLKSSETAYINGAEFWENATKRLCHLLRAMNAAQLLRISRSGAKPFAQPWFGWFGLAPGCLGFQKNGHQLCIEIAHSRELRKAFHRLDSIKDLAQTYSISMYTYH